MHAALAFGFALTGSFRALAVLSVVAVLLIYLVSCLATLRLRFLDVRTDGVSFRIPGGPTVPLLASVVVLWLLSSATGAEFIAVAEVLVVASGLYLLRRVRRVRRSAVAPAVAESG